MKVKLTYFRADSRAGKYYSDGEYTSRLPEGTPLYTYWDEVSNMANRRELPGLIEGHDAYIISVDVPEHPHNHPHLLVPEHIKQTTP